MKLQNSVDENGYLRSRKKQPKKSDVKGSLYQMIESATQRRIADKSDWTLIQNGLTGEQLSASQTIALGKRYGTLLILKGSDRMKVQCKSEGSTRALLCRGFP